MQGGSGSGVCSGNTVCETKIPGIVTLISHLSSTLMHVFGKWEESRKKQKTTPNPHLEHAKPLTGLGWNAKTLYLYLNKLKEFLSVITALSMDTLENSSRNVCMQTVYVNSTVYVKINLEAIDIEEETRELWFYGLLRANRTTLRAEI